MKYKIQIAYEFNDFDDQYNDLLTKYDNILNIIIKKVVVELRKKNPKSVDEAMKEIDTIINTFKETENSNDRKKQFEINKETIKKLSTVYKEILNYKKQDNQASTSDSENASFTGFV